MGTPSTAPTLARRTTTCYAESARPTKRGHGARQQRRRLGHERRFSTAMPVNAEKTESLVGILKLCDQITAEWKGSAWPRGQSDAGWTLKPSAYRNRPWQFESAALWELKRRAPVRYANCPPDGDLGGWLSLMQHYRLPTRLLDWSQSVLVAAFFACNHQEEDGAIWALRPLVLNQFAFSQNGIDPVTGILTFEARLPFFLEIIGNPFSAKEGPPSVVAVLPHERDPRVMTQLSAFTVHGNRAPLESDPNAEEFLRKVVIPKTAKPQILQSLHRAGIREEVLFPDLECLARNSALAADALWPVQIT